MLFASFITFKRCRIVFYAFFTAQFGDQVSMNSNPIERGGDYAAIWALYREASPQIESYRDAQS